VVGFGISFDEILGSVSPHCWFRNRDIPFTREVNVDFVWS
jgi:hypothetical protein